MRRVEVNGLRHEHRAWMHMVGFNGRHRRRIDRQGSEENSSQRDDTHGEHVG